MSALGHCDSCHGDLALSGPDVVCTGCGMPQPGHAVAVAERARPKPAPVPASNIRPEDLGHSVDDRLRAVEKKLTALAQVQQSLRDEIHQTRALLEQVATPVAVREMVALIKEHVRAQDAIARLPRKSA